MALRFGAWLFNSYVDIMSEKQWGERKFFQLMSYYTTKAYLCKL